VALTWRLGSRRIELLADVFGVEDLVELVRVWVQKASGSAVCGLLKIIITNVDNNKIITR
jgi:hypothetical protein